MISIHDLQKRFEALRTHAENAAKELKDRVARIAARTGTDARTGYDPVSPVDDDEHVLTPLMTHKWQTAGWAVVVVFFVGGITWSGLTRIDGAAIALGTVGVESNRKSVAHLEGGIVKAILVKEGERVSVGQPLIEMDNTRAHATLELLQGRRDSLVAKRARLDAERRDLQSIEFPAELLDRADDPKLLDIMDGEMQVLDTRRKNIDRQDRILKERIAQQRAEIRGFQAKRTATQKRVNLLREEFEMMSDLLKDGLVAKNRVLSVERKLVDAEGDIHDLAAKIAKSNDETAKLEMERALLLEQNHKEVAADHQETQKQMAEVDERIRAARDILDRTLVAAPSDGVVVALQQHTPGGVVKAGQPILDIVPDNEDYVIELRIDPNDIDTVYPGQPARVRLTAFNARTTPEIEGKVTQISPDRLIDPATGASYYTGRVLPNEGTLGPGGPDMMVPGMQAEVFLVTAERSVLDYLLDPLTRTLHRAGREL